jgi:hypothetical protein
MTSRGPSTNTAVSASEMFGPNYTPPPDDAEQRRQDRDFIAIEVLLRSINPQDSRRWLFSYREIVFWKLRRR